MKIGAEQAALITGAASGIGRALALALAEKGVRITVADISEEHGYETVRLVEEVHRKLAKKLESPSAVFVQCDVSKPGNIVAAFDMHQQTFGHLDICVNNAGIGDQKSFLDDRSVDGKGSWRQTVDINLTAVIDGTRIAVQAMEGRGGVIVNVASAAGLYPSSAQPIYSASKAGVVMFTRSLSKLKAKGIRVNALCPEFIVTPLVEKMSATQRKWIENSTGYISMDKVIEGSFMLMEDESKAGACLWISNRRGFEYWPDKEEEKKYMLSSAGAKLQRKPPPHLETPPPVPKEFHKVVVHKLSADFRAATKIVTVFYKPPVKPGHILIKVLYAGVNASDINFSSGFYHGKEIAATKLPYDSGFEAIGLVAGMGEGVSADAIRLGSPVATVFDGGFSEYREIAVKHAFPVPAAIPEIVAILTSGLTASIGLEQAGKMKSGETVLVTAAAGGTGQFAVQLAKIAGNKVVATCGGARKAALLRGIGVDRVIDYTQENIKLVLKREFPNGVNIVYESVGGEMFQTCMNSLAVFGRMVLIGMISQYAGETPAEGWKRGNYPGLCEKLLAKSQTLTGFYVNHYRKLFKEHIEKLYNLYSAGDLKITIDPTRFVGLNSVADAVEYLHSGHSIGKVVVQVAPDAVPAQQSRL
ncbi:unnamed protein product [Sphagnum troendelagicum]